MVRISLLTALALAACAPHAVATSSPASSPTASASPAAADAATAARITIERDRLIIVRGGETRALADRDDLPDLLALDALLGTPGPGTALTVELADAAIYADLRAVLKTANLHGLDLSVGPIAVAGSDELPGADIPMLAVSDAQISVGPYQASTPDPLIVSTVPDSDAAVAVAAVRVAELAPAPTVVLLVIDPGTSGAVVNRVMRALHVHGIERAVFGARRG